jgi:methylated-DNA-protein-cysteine methyltransferase related protein
MNEAPKRLSSYKLIWQTVKQIPKGKVATYGQVAELSGLKNQARLVGYALHNLPEMTKIPWQRVINSSGKISFPSNSITYRLQKSLLEKEGIKFINGKIDIRAYGWIYDLQAEWKNK